MAPSQPGLTFRFRFAKYERAIIKKFGTKWFRGIKSGMKDPEEGGDRRRRVRKACLLVEVGADVVF